MQDIQDIQNTVTNQTTKPIQGNQENESIYVNPDSIAGYAIRRNLSSNLLYDVFAVDSEGEILFCAYAGIGYYEASNWVDSMNTEYFPVVPTPTEAVFIEIGGVEKVYNITATASTGKK